MKTLFILINLISFLSLPAFSQVRAGKLSKVPGTKSAQYVNEDSNDDTITEAKRGPAQIVDDREIIEKAKSHSYKGGAEEGELRVQAQLPKPQRKIAPVVDKKDDKDSQDHD